MCLGVLQGVKAFCVAYISVVSLSAYYPVPAVQGQIHGTYGYRSLHVVIRFPATLSVVGVGVVCRLSQVAADAEAQSLHGVVVNACCKAIAVGGLEFEGRTGAVVNPLVAVEEHGVKSCHHLQLIAELAVASPEGDTCVVPC